MCYQTFCSRETALPKDRRHALYLLAGAQVNTTNGLYGEKSLRLSTAKGSIEGRAGGIVGNDCTASGLRTQLHGRRFFLDVDRDDATPKREWEDLRVSGVRQLPFGRFWFGLAVPSHLAVG
jgi:hypothetical protein